MSDSQEDFPFQQFPPFPSPEQFEIVRTDGNIIKLKPYTGYIEISMSLPELDEPLVTQIICPTNIEKCFQELIHELQSLELFELRNIYFSES